MTLTAPTVENLTLGFVPDDYSEGLAQGWMPLLERVQKQAEAGGNARR